MSLLYSSGRPIVQYGRLDGRVHLNDSEFSSGLITRPVVQRVAFGIVTSKCLQHLISIFQVLDSLLVIKLYVVTVLVDALPIAKSTY